MSRHHGPPGVDRVPRRYVSYAARASSRSPVIVCHLFYEGDDTSTRNPGPTAPVDSCRPHEWVSRRTRTTNCAPIVDGREGPISDPLPQALILTAIVIAFAITAFLLALAVRAWAATSEDFVEDDLEDRRIASTSGGGAG